jgi:YceI-like domain
MTFLLLSTLLACSGDTATTPEPPPKPIEAPAVPLDLVVTDGEIAIVSVKNGDTEVPGQFPKVTGALRFADGARQRDLSGLIEVDVASWTSGLDERDNNVRSAFFDIAAAPVARFALGGLTGLPEAGVSLGEEAVGKATGKFTLGAGSVDLSTQVRLRHSGDDDWHVDSVEPIWLSVEALGMKPRLLALMELCKHKSVDDNIKVSFHLQLGAPSALPAVVAMPVAPVAVPETTPAVDKTQENKNWQPEPNPNDVRRAQHGKEPAGSQPRRLPK